MKPFTRTDKFILAGFCAAGVLALAAVLVSLGAYEHFGAAQVQDFEHVDQDELAMWKAFSPGKIAAFEEYQDYVYQANGYTAGAVLAFVMTMLGILKAKGQALEAWRNKIVK